MAKKKIPPAPSAPLARSQELWLLACAAMTLAPLAAHAPSWVGLGAALALAWRGLIWWRRRPLPPRWLRTVLVLAGVGGVLLTYRQVFGKDPGLALLMLFLALKLMELRGPRDALAALFLCYFLLFAGFLYAQSIAAAGMALAALIVVTAALASLQHAGRPVAAHLRLSALMLAQAAPFMLVLFLLFPRVQGPLWGLPLDAYSGLSGLSDTMAPGSISQLSLSGAIAFRVQFEGEPPPQPALYWRGPVLSQFDGRTWRTASRSTSNTLPYGVQGAGVAYAVTLEPHNKTWLFALEMPASLPQDAVIATDYQVRSRSPVRNRLRYELRSVPGLTPGADEPAESVELNLRTPPGNPRTRALAAEWRRQSAGAEALVRRALDHFRRESFAYTLNPPLLGEDSVDEFLFGTRRGFCEHYAAAFVLLMRAGGVPARVVTGYQGGERNPVDGYWVVRQADAHAWAEVWLPGRGWVRVDPTAAIAPSRIEAGIARALPASDPLPFVVRTDLSWLRELRFRWEATTNSWNQWVLGYNAERQRNVLSRLGMPEPDWRRMAAALAFACALLTLALVGWALRRRTRLDPALRAWNRLSGKLAGIGLARQTWEGPADYARRVAGANPGLGPPVERIAALYIAARYGRGGNAAPLQEMKRLIAELNVGALR
ncbi:MAG: DUF3488 domain-containing transglutaminase family protein [Rhodocyclales bacterium]|nr:DUF3488 domain-containing transglutaminase family protein [Rhodocyclales bacterium]